MARKKGQRRQSLQPLKFGFEMSLTTLASNAGQLASTIAALEQDFDIVSTHLLIAMRDHTANEGPLEFGLAERNYSTAEIIEALDASPLSQYGTAWERSKRKVRSYGMLSGAEGDETPNDGLVIKRRMFLRAASGQVPANMFVINRDSAALTTGTVIEVTGTHWGRWK